MAEAEKRKRVKFIQTLSTGRDCFIKDHEYEIPADEADQFVKEGNAVAVKAKKAKGQQAPADENADPADADPSADD